MRSMSLLVVRRAFAMAIAAGAFGGVAADAQPAGSYSDAYSAYDQQYGQYGRYGSDQDQGQPAYSGGMAYGQSGYGSPYGGAYGQPQGGAQYGGGYGQYQPGSNAYGGYGYGGQSGYPYGYGAYSQGRSDRRMDDYNADSYGAPGYAPSPYASPGYSHDAGSPGYYGNGNGYDNDEGGPPPSSYDRDGRGSSTSGYPLPPN